MNEKGKISETLDNDNSAGLLWESADGLDFGNPELGCGRMDAYISKELAEKSPCYYYRKFERPQILMRGGYPAYLYTPAGVNITGGEGSCSYVLKIKPAGTK